MLGAKFNELMPDFLTMSGDLLKGEGEDLQSLCAECDDANDSETWAMRG